MVDDQEDSDSSSDEDDEHVNLLKDLDRPKLPVQKLNHTLRPPLPLILFKGLGIRSEGVKTINGEEIRSIVNNLSPNRGGTDSLQDLLYTRRLAKWFSSRSYKEAAIRQPKSYFRAGTLGCEEHYSIKDVLVYKSTFFDGEKKAPQGTSGSSLGAEVITEGDANACEIRKSSLVFDSNFESGNLFKAVLVTGREKLMSVTTNQLPHQSTIGTFGGPDSVDQEYDLTLRNDLNTTGNIQWYYFSASTEAMCKESSQNIIYPLRVRFNIINMQKKDALYNFGMKPATFSSINVRDDWRHRGEDICYYKLCQHPSDDISEDKRKKNECYVLTFTYTYLSPATVHFAHTFPYTYTDLKKYLASLEENTRIAGIMSRKELCTTIAGNICECVTITGKATELGGGALKPAIVISARIHPGESNSSYMMNGVIDYLVSDCPEAKVLRDTFIFKLVPMLNPDGVIHGNYRCSLMGTDLNRRYLNTHPSLYPTVAAMKTLLAECENKRGVLLFLDLHGHSKKKNAFLYGSDCTLQSDKLSALAISSQSPEQIISKKIFARTFARVLCSVSDVSKGGYFSYRDSTFNVENTKRSTGRVVSWRELGIQGTFTIEASFCGSGNNDEKKIIRQYEDANQFAGMSLQLSDMLKPSVDLGSTNSRNSNNIDYKTVRGPINASEILRSCSGGQEQSGYLDKTNSYDMSVDSLGNREQSYGGDGGLGSSPSYSGFRNRSSSQSLHVLTPALAALARKNSMSQIDKSSSSRKRSTMYKDTGDPVFDKLIRSYETAVHYSKQDLRNIGKDIARAIFSFANLDATPTAHVTPPLKTPAFDGRKTSGSRVSSVDSGPCTESKNSDSGKDNNRGGYKSNRTSFDDQPAVNEELEPSQSSDEYLDGAMLLHPLLKASVFSTEAIALAYKEYPAVMQNSRDDSFVRLKSEMSIRRSLKLDCPRGISGPGSGITGSSSGPNGDDMEEREGGGGDDGSDSEPSVDNIPASKLFGKRSLASLKDSKNLVKALQKAVRKRRKAAEKLYTKQERKRIQEELEEAATASTTSTVRETYNQLKNQKAMVRVLSTKATIEARRQGSPEPMLRMQLERHYPLQIQSIIGQNPRLAVRRAELGNDPDHNPANTTNSILPKMERMFETEILTGSGFRGDIAGPNKPIRPKSASIARNRLLPNNPFFFTLPPNEGESLSPRAQRKRDTHLKPFGPSSGISSGILNNTGILNTTFPGAQISPEKSIQLRGSNPFSRS